MLPHEKSVSAEKFHGKQSASRGRNAMTVTVGVSLEMMVGGRKLDEDEVGSFR